VLVESTFPDWVAVVVLVEERSEKQLRVRRSAEALGQLLETARFAPQGVVLEATGGLEGAVISALAAGGLR